MRSTETPVHLVNRVIEEAVHPRRRAPAVAVVVAVTTLLLTACVSNPTEYPHGEVTASSTGGSALRTVAVYILVPLLVGVVIAAMVWLPGMARGTRYRPQQGWSAAPIWFAGPSDPVSAVEQARVGDLARGGTGGDW